MCGFFLRVLGKRGNTHAANIGNAITWILTGCAHLWVRHPPPLPLLHPHHTSLVGPGVSVAGWGTWNLFGCWGYNWTEVDVRGMADALVSSGMKDAGYEYINLVRALPSTHAPTRARGI
eukprot:COSAG04_NODE_1786_length_5583_cov_2.997082_6_plen_119_part_00